MIIWEHWKITKATFRHEGVIKIFVPRNLDHKYFARQFIIFLNSKFRFSKEKNWIFDFSDFQKNREFSQNFRFCFRFSDFLPVFVCIVEPFFSTTFFVTSFFCCRTFVYIFFFFSTNFTILFFELFFVQIFFCRTSKQKIRPISPQFFSPKCLYSGGD